MECQQCHGPTRRFGKNRNGSQRFRCDACRLTFTDAATRPVDRRQLSPEKAILCLRMLLEGNSVRSIERITGVHRDTILALLVAAGERCLTFFHKRIRDVPARNVQVDEIWGFVFCKEKTRKRNGYESPLLGDAYCFIGIERDTKLVLAWELGRRNTATAMEFAEKLRRAVPSHFQLTTDGFASYREVVPEVFGPDLDFAQLIKIYGVPADEKRYSPMEVIDTIVVVSSGTPDPKAICTSHIERQNLTLRMQIRRLTRLTNAHSKKWENHQAALALFFAYYNFCRVHSTIGCTPAVESELTTETWSLQRLLDEAAKC